MLRVQIVRALAILAGALFLFCTSVSPVSAGEVGSVQVHVTEGRGGRPVAIARVYLIGDRSDFGYTDANGNVTFDNFPLGPYQVSVYAPNYSHASAAFNVVAGTTDVAVVLSKVGDLATIASVTVRTRLSAEIGRGSARDASTQMTGGLGGVLFQIPFLNSGIGGVSIDGAAPANTAVSADGMALAGAGNSTALTPIGLDLFQSLAAQPTGSAQPGIQLFTDNPTIAFSANSTSKVDSLGGIGTTSLVTGTTGNVGYVIKHVGESLAGSLDGLAFLDASGTTYSHPDEGSGTGTLLKVRVPLSTSDSILATSSGINEVLRPACNIASGSVPCTFGSDASTSEAFSDSSVLFDHEFPNSSLRLSLNRSNQGETTDWTSRVVDNSPAPWFASYGTSTSAADIQVERAFGTTHTIELDATADRQTVANGGDAFSPQDAQTYHSVNVGETFTPRLNESIVADAAWQDGNVGFGLHYDRAPSPDSEFSTDVRLRKPEQPVLPSIPLYGSVTDPASASYDCFHQHIFANGASEESGTPEDSGITMAYKVQRGSSMAFSVQASHDDIQDGFVSTLTPGTAIGLNAVTASQLAALSAFYASPAACNSPAPLTPASVIFTAPISANIRYDRLVASSAYQFGSLTVAPYVQLTSAEYRAMGVSQRIPFVPEYRAGTLLHLNVKGVEFLAYGSYVDSNNSLGLPRYVDLNLGFRRELIHGALTVGVTNATNVWARQFASSAFAAPLDNGIVPIASPLARRALHVTYDVMIGGKRRVPNIDVLSALAQAAQPSQDTFSLSFKTLDSGTTHFDFQPDQSLDSCTPEALDLARQELNAMSNESQRESGLQGDADTDVPMDPNLAVTIVAHRRGGRVSFELQAHNQRAQLRSAACVIMHAVTADQLRARGAYVPTETESAQSLAFFDVSVGAYRLFDLNKTQAKAQQQPAETVTLDPIPSTPPSDPFALRPTCPTRLAPFATEILAEFKSRLPAATGGKAVEPSRFFRITVRGAASNRWAAIHFLDAPSQQAVETCAHVVGASTSDLTALGIDDSAQSFGFSPKVGLFEPL